MMHSHLWLILLIALPLCAAESKLNVEQLLHTVVDGIESGSGDAELARQIERTKLTQCLSDQDIRWLTDAGAGPRTIRALRKLEEQSASLPSSSIISFELRPGPAEINHILQGAIDYVHRYTATLVDFTCTVTTTPYTREPSERRPFSNTSIVITEPSGWRQGKTITQEVSYYRGREYSSKGKRGKQKAAQGISPGASWTNGEFAQLLRITFARSTQARFDWDHWEWQAGKRLAVFSYSIGAAHSQLILDTQVARTGVWQRAQLSSAYHGFFYADPESGAIFRLIANTVGIPSEYAVNQGNTILDYGPVEIAGKTYLLLAHATSYISTKQYESLFRKTYTRYRKFEAESKMIGAN